MFLNTNFQFSCQLCTETGTFLLQNDTCVKCVENCQICSDVNLCSQCIPDFYLLPNLTQCVFSNPGGFGNSNNFTLYACDQSCTSCYGKTNAECTQCAASYYSYLNLCISSCPQNTTLINGQCLSNYLWNKIFNKNNLFRLHRKLPDLFPESIKQMWSMFKSILCRPQFTMRVMQWHRRNNFRKLLHSLRSKLWHMFITNRMPKMQQGLWKKFNYF